MYKEKIAAFYPVRIDRSDEHLVYYTAPRFPSDIRMILNATLFNLVPDKGYLLKYKFFDYSETLFYHFDVHYKLLSETITEDQRFGDYASAIQQLATPFIRIIETARQFRIVMELWDLDETQDKETVKLDDAVCYTAVRQEEHNE